MTTLYLASTLPFGDNERFQFHYATLPAFRKEKVDALRFPEDKRRCLCAWLLLVQVLGEHGISSTELKIACGKNGKPFLVGNNQLHFNLSHAGENVMCAISDQEVGCDIERLRPVNGNLAKRFFSPAELEALSALPQDQRQAFFFRLWTCKESFVKAVGTGLSLPLRDFSLYESGSQMHVRQSLFPDRPFFFRDFSLQDGYHCACCAASPDISQLITRNLSNV